jgi:hypothetical protein
LSWCSKLGGSSKYAIPIHNDFVWRKKRKGRRTGKGDSAMMSGMNGTPGFRAAHIEKGTAKAVIRSSLTIKLMATAPV